MTKRYYYDDPLAAAWMAKHFGMKFYDGENANDVWDWIDVCSWLKCIPWEIERIPTHYIHPDSLHILKAGIGDLLQYESHKIIQRNGIPFHWPKEEENV